MALPPEVRAQDKVVMPRIRYGFTVAAGELAGGTFAPEFGVAELPGEV
jgi:hypothetical protein